VIGSRARNWPIRDGQDQARLIAQSVAHTIKYDDGLGTTVKQMGDVTITSRPTSPRKNANNVTRDPHASLSLFGPRDDTREETYTDQGVAPRASAKPASRDYNDLFVEDSKDRPPSPTKEDGPYAPKHGAGKNFQPSRLFDNEQPEPVQVSPVKVHATKYSHFEFGDGSDEPRQPTKLRPKSKHQSQWDFADFNTPVKIPQRHRPDDVRHFGFGEEEANVEAPTKHTKPIQPRRDAETHFEFKDDGTPVDRPTGHPRGAGASNGTALYKNYLFEEDGAPVEEKRGHRPMSSVTSVKDRKKDFDPHFEIEDPTPGLGEKTASENNRPIPETRLKAIKMMNAQWDATDANPTPTPRQAPSSPSIGKENIGIAIAGDGMGGRKGATSGENRSVGIKTGGDGMGGRKGMASTWGFGDESDEFGAEGAKKEAFRAGKKQLGPKDSSIWDF
jgi:hypothetical protein